MQHCRNGVNDHVDQKFMLDNELKRKRFLGLGQNLSQDLTSDANNLFDDSSDRFNATSYKSNKSGFRDNEEAVEPVDDFANIDVQT